MTMGLVHDHAGSYGPMVFVFSIALLISVVLVFCLGPYKFASRQALAVAAAAAVPEAKQLALSKNV
jgi:hypothetical protein